MKKVRVAINGFGRIGRAFFRMAEGRDDLEIVAINDLGSLENLAYLLKYDTAYGRSPFGVEVKDGNLVAAGKTVRFVSEREPAQLPWKELDIDVVVEATGIFTTYEAAKAHRDAGAKRVVLTAPAKDEPEKAGVKGATVLMGINDEHLADYEITSNASCTTNAASPLVAILDEAIGIERALLNTTHAYTASQSLVDGPNKKDLRDGRAAAHNMIPSTTGAAIAVTKAYPKLEGKFDGLSVRVPVIVGSLVDVTFVASRATTVEEVNNALKAAAASERWRGIFAVTEEPLVSSDIIGATYASIADLGNTLVADGTLVKVLAWYDNETSYTHTLVEHVVALGKTVGA
ncbi:type I glyceraldehyde-3-phosphate dehydrogenase [Candidatus Kaiserbacteria bacterium]|nr:type I glyceraldehyde-3-phosphate dehydrogenase [Candidatus Kaiserbacteria bacterium]